MKLAIFDVFFTISQYLGNGGRYGPGYSYSLRGDIKRQLRETEWYINNL